MAVIFGESGAHYFELQILNLGPFALKLPWLTWIHMREGEGCLGLVAAVLVVLSVFVSGRRAELAAATILSVTTLVAGVLTISALAPLRPQAHDLRDQFLYYLGAKYYDEVGYEDLNRCLLEAAKDLDLPLPDIYRDSATNAIVNTRASLASAAPCRERFSEARWASLESDLVGFTPGLFAWQGQWQKVFLDYGFNGTPVLRRLISAAAVVFPATHRGLTLVGLLNLAAVFIGLFSVLAWVGWRESLVCALLLFVYAGDSFVHLMSIPRYFWYASILTGVSLLHRGGKWAGPAAGALLAFSAGLKAFPATWMVGPVLLAAAELVRRKRGDSVRVVLGAAAAAAVLLLWTVADAHHFANWTEFANRMSLNGNRATTGCIGFAFDFLRPIPGPDLNLQPMLRTLDAPLLGPITLHHLQWALQVLLTLAIGRACLLLDRARASMLGGFGLMFVWFVPVSYYYAGFLGLPLLFPLSRGRVTFAVASAWLLVSAGISGLMFERVHEALLYTLFLSTSFTIFLVGALAVLEIEHRTRKNRFRS
jgi:hypothetical protein